jgi:hypothetical protein
VSSWHEPFAPPPPAPPLGANPRDDDGHRFDDSHGRFRTLYCATSADGALGECWALWEPLPIIASDVDSMPVTIDTVALRLAADKLGIALQA